MIIATFNVNSVRSRLPILTRWLEEVRPDFLFMQETKTQDENFPSLAFQGLGYTSHYHGEKSYNGVAVLVKKELDDVKISFGFDDGEFSTRLLTLTYNDIIILNSYVPQGQSIDAPQYEVKKEFFARVKKIIDQHGQEKFLWLGDMNVAPNPEDVTHPEAKKNHVCFCDEIREIFADTKKSLVDVLRLFEKHSGVFTFFDYRVKDAVNRKIGWRIDHILASQKLADLAANCYVDIRPRTWERPSDHTPLIAEFRLWLVGKSSINHPYK